MKINQDLLPAFYFLDIDNINSTLITDNTNLNTLLKPGIYRCTSNATAATVLNSPYTTGVFKLRVEKIHSSATSTSRILQYLQPSSGVTQHYWRVGSITYAGVTSFTDWCCGGAMVGTQQNSTMNAYHCTFINNHCLPQPETWTPTMMNVDNVTYTTRTGQAYKLGPLVFFMCQIRGTLITPISSKAYARISGLPYTVIYPGGVAVIREYSHCVTNEEVTPSVVLATDNTSHINYLSLQNTSTGRGTGATQWKSYTSSGASDDRFYIHIAGFYWTEFNVS